MKNRVMMVALVAFMAASMLLTGCYSVFSGGTGGRVVDTESTDSPKRGIADVDVYAYVDKKACQKDFDSWKEGTKFKPEAKYYAHTSTASDGSFTISKLMWKSMMPDYWRDGDVATVYLLYYHDEYGLVQGDSTLLLSDSTTNTVYQELKAVRQKTALDLRIVDVATNRTTDKTLNVTVAVNHGNTYTATITGRGTVTISYPRDTSPDIKVTFTESSQKPSFKMCKDGTNDDWSFDDSPQIISGVGGDSFSADVLGKKSRVDISVSGNATDNGLLVELKKGSETLDSTYTRPTNLGNGQVRDGDFSGLGAGYIWETGNYGGKIESETFSVNGKDISITTANPDVYVTLP